ncbi:MAG: domain S-box, partial [Verrucomicrobiales bacterium]|nr:domain S-box [Verrucomicrobiales bacterium]
LLYKSNPAQSPALDPEVSHAVMNALSNAVICIDESGVVRFFNPAAQTLFGIPATDVEKRFAATIFSLQTLAASVEKLVQDGKSSGSEQFHILRPDKTKATVEGRHSLQITNSGWICTTVFQNFTEQQLEPGALYQYQKTQAIGTLASGVAHDFNNILTAVISNLDLMELTAELPASLRHNVSQAKISARRGAELVSRLLSFSRQSDPHPAAVNLSDINREVVAMLRRSIDRRINIGHEFPPDLSLVHADGTQMMQVVMNLCLNARDAMPSGGTIHIRLSNVSFNQSVLPPRKSGRFVQLTVEDTGEGIPADVMARLFEPYFTTKKMGRGTGLGLFIAQSVVAEHGGWLEVNSKQGIGSTFSAFIPAMLSSTKQSQPVTTLDSPGTQNSLDGKERILIVDDEEFVRLVTRAVLGYRGYTMVEAVDGAEGVEKYKNAEIPFDLVLMDLHLPKMNGWDALAQIKQFDPKAKVIMLSGGSAAGFDEKGQELGASGFLEKPFENINLLKMVRKLLDA